MEFSLARAFTLTCAVLFLVFGSCWVVSCAIKTEDLSPEKAAKYVDLMRAEAIAKAAKDPAVVKESQRVIDDANADPIAKIAAIEIVKVSADPNALKFAQDQLEAFETEIFRERAGPLLAGVAAVAPGLVGWIPVIQMFVTPLLGARSRGKLGSAIKESPKLLQRNPQALIDFAAAMGWAHTSAETKAVAKGDAVAVSNESMAMIEEKLAASPALAPA